MILRRVIENIRTQNWVAIGVDFAIVVFGVFIGTQVSNWNDRQNEISVGQRFERELISDMREDQRRLVLSDTYFRQVEESARRTIVQLEAGQTDDPAGLLVDAYTASQYIYNSPSRTTYDELVATGGLRLIEDEALRETAVFLYTSEAQLTLPEYVRTSAYRDALRRALPFSAQQAIRESCGDIRDETGDIIGLNLPCALDLGQPEVERAVAILFAHPSLREDLRSYVSTLLAYIDDQALIIRTIEPILSTYEEKEAAG